MAMTDYEYYSKIFGGNRISKDDYPRFADMAMSYITLRTFGRKARENDVDTVKNCECELADIYARASSFFGMKSHSTDGESISFDTENSAVQRHLSDTVTRRLSLTGLLYSGGTYI